MAGKRCPTEQPTFHMGHIFQLVSMLVEKSRIQAGYLMVEAVLITFVVQPAKNGI